MCCVLYVQDTVVGTSGFMLTVRTDTSKLTAISARVGAGAILKTLSAYMSGNTQLTSVDATTSTNVQSAVRSRLWTAETNP